MKEIFRVILFLAALCSSLILTSCASKNSDPAPRSGGGGRPGGMTVSGVVVSLQPLDNVVNASGTVLASESVDLSAEASGTVEAILFKEGGHVRKNDLLVKLKDEDLQADLRADRGIGAPESGPGADRRHGAALRQDCRDAHRRG